MRVVIASPAAEAAGVRPGLGVAAARALCAALVVLRDDPPADARALERLAVRLLRFTPDVCVDGKDALQLEIGRTAHHFGGEAALVGQVRESCRALGHEAALGVAATPEAARVLARAALLGHAGDEAGLERCPWQALAPEEPVAQACTALGVRTIGELLALPRAGLATRTTIAFVQQLQRLRGELDEPLARVVPPERFEDELDLLDPATSAAPLLFAAKRLFDAAEAELEARSRLLVSATVTLVPVGREAPRAITIAPSEPTRSAQLLVRLLAHRLERERLAAPIDRVQLAFERSVPCRARQDALFEQAAREVRDRDVGHLAAALRDRLAVRLGDPQVQTAELVADWRPERAFRLRRHGEAAPAAGGGEPAAEGAPGPRPLELDADPMPLQVDVDRDGAPRALRERGRGVPLRVVRGPERIASGWWDGRDVERAYFEVETGEGARLWLFCDLRSGAFFRHGTFS